MYRSRVLCVVLRENENQLKTRYFTQRVRLFFSRTASMAVVACSEVGGVAEVSCTARSYRDSSNARGDGGIFRNVRLECPRWDPGVRAGD